MAPLVGIRACFHQLLLFQEVTHLWHWSILSVIPACLVDTPNFQSYTLHKLFLITRCFHDSTHLPIIPGGVCFLQDHNISKFKFLLVFVDFFLSWSDCKNSFLQQHQNSFTMCWNHLHLVWLYNCINYVLKNLLEVARLSLISWLIDMMETGQTTGGTTNIVSCQRLGIQDSLCLCH